jgi:hypothetical protein
MMRHLLTASFALAILFGAGAIVIGLSTIISRNPVPSPKWCQGKYWPEGCPFTKKAYAVLK